MDTYPAGSIIYRNFNTHKADGTPITLAGTPAVRCYKDDGTTEDDSGITLTVDFDSKTGLHNVKIDTSQDGTFYATGHDYSVVIAVGTVDGISVAGTEVFCFRLGAVPAALAASQPNYAPAKAGDAMALIDDAITKSKYDESTAFPSEYADSGSTKIARSGADSDTLETLSDQIDGKSSHSAADVWAVSVRALTDKAGFSLSTAPPTAAQIRAEMDANSKLANATYGLAALKALLDTIDDYVDAEVAAIKAKTDNLPALPAAQGDIPGAAAIASQVRTELATELARLDVLVSSRLAASGYVAPANSDIAAILILLSAITADWGPMITLRAKTYTLLDGQGDPAPGVEVWATSDEAGLNRIDIIRTTNDLGQVTFQFNLPSGTTVYIWNRGSETADEEVI